MRNAKKNIVKKTKLVSQKSLLDCVSAVYNLLDAHVYLKNNLWSSAIESIYTFVDRAFNYITFREVLILIEGAFYRSLFNYFIFRNKSKVGVMIPDYAMRYIEPQSYYMCTPKDKEINLEYHDVKIDRAASIGLISMGL